MVELFDFYLSLVSGKLSNMKNTKEGQLTDWDINEISDLFANFMESTYIEASLHPYEWMVSDLDSVFVVEKSL
jgi:hypothetical protein